MTLSAFYDIMLVFVGWSVQVCMFVGLGLLVLQFAHVCKLTWDWFFRAFWFGFAIHLVFLQLWHLFFPINKFIVVLLCGFGVLGVVLNSGEILRIYKKNKLPMDLLIFISLVAIWLANRCLLLPLHEDTGRYHLMVVEWNNSYPIIPGLANLCPRYGFNSTHFLYGAAIYSLGFGVQSMHVANSIFLLITFLYILIHANTLRISAKVVSVSDIFLMIFGLALIPEFFNGHFNGFSTDLLPFLIGLIIAIEFLALIGNKPYKPFEKNIIGIYIVLLACICITSKLSFTAIGFCSSLVALKLFLIPYLKQQSGICLKPIVVWGLIPVVVIGPWVVGNIILSGYPLYPSSICGVSFDWQVPKEMMQMLQNDIAVCGQYPWVYQSRRLHVIGGYFLDELHEQNLSRGVEWFVAWCHFFSKQKWFYVHILFPAFVSIIAAIVLGVGVLRNGFNRNSLISKGLILAPWLFGLIFWFSTSPMPRYIGSTMWVLSAILVALACHVWQIKVLFLSRLAFPVLVCVFLLLLSGYTWRKSAKSLPICYNQKCKNGFENMPVIQYRTITTRYGVKVHYSKSGYLWGVPLPCTDMPRYSLKIRRDGDIESGFSCKGTISEDIKLWLGHDIPEGCR